MEEKKLKEVFTEVYHNNTWGEKTSASGPGSSLAQTVLIRGGICQLIKDYKIKLFLDAPCGDFYWMREIINEITLSLDVYFGADIIEELIQKNSKEYGTEKVKFLHLNLVEQKIPKVDLILTRDCFIHLSFMNIYKILKNYKNSGSKYILVNTYEKTDRINKDVTNFYIHGRALNMRKFPFYFPKPLRIINEGCTEGNGAYTDKSLALWDLNEIPLLKLSFNLKYLVIKNICLRIKNKIYKTLLIK